MVYKPVTESKKKLTALKKENQEGKLNDPPTDEVVSQFFNTICIAIKMFNCLCIKI